MGVDVITYMPGGRVRALYIDPAGRKMGPEYRADAASRSSSRVAVAPSRREAQSRVAGFLAAHDWSYFANHVHEIYLSISG
jgi:hypothetical protein